MYGIIDIANINTVAEMEEVRRRLYNRAINLYKKAVNPAGELMSYRAYLLQAKTMLLHNEIKDIIVHGGTSVESKISHHTAPNFNANGKGGISIPKQNETS